MFDATKVKFGELVWHDKPYFHPQLGKQVHRDFYDRTKEIERSEAVLKSGSRKPVILIAERRGGKTSLMRLLGEHLAKDASGRFLPVIIPWQGINTSDLLIREIHQGLRAAVSPVGSTASLPAAPDSSATTIGGFLEGVRGLLAGVPGKLAVICIDEFDSILESASPGEAGRILGLAHGLIEATDLDVTLLLTMAGIPPMIQGSRPSPLISKSQLIQLKPFEEADLNEMVTGILEGENHPLSSEDLRALYELSGGWPYFAKLLLVCLADCPTGPDQINEAAKAAIQHDSARRTIQNIYDTRFDDDEKAVALLLAHRDGRASADDMSVLGAAFRTAARQLTERGFVWLDPDGSCRFRVGLLTAWFRNWAKCELEMERRLGTTLLRLKRITDPWAGSHPTIVEAQVFEQHSRWP